MSAISVEGVSKRYRKGTTGYRTLREDLYTLTGRLLDFGSEKRRDADAQHMWALRDVSFEVKPGERVGIIGRNGSGKTTLLRLLAGVTRPTHGTITVRGRMGVLIEIMAGFHPELTGRENVYLNGAIMGMSRREIAAKFDEIVAFSEIEDWIDTPIKRYSSGMHVRLGFAVAAHLDPDILLVDEVLAVGDAAFQKKCLGKMSDVGSEGRTVLFVSHNMVAVQRLCPRSILLKDGSLSIDGTSNQVVQEYLSDNQKSQVESIWQDLDKAPGNELARLRGVRIVNASGTAVAGITDDEAFKIEVTYYVKQEGLRAGTTAVLFNSEGTCIFSSISNREQQWHGKPHPVGLYRSICQVPKLLLSDGEYSLTIILWAGNYQPVCRADNVASFRIIDSGETREDYMGGWAGVIRPLLKWETEQITASDIRQR